MPIVPWLDQPVMLHSSRDPGECTMTPEQCAYKSQYWLFWYQADRRYGLPTIAFFLVAIILFTLGNWVSLFAPQSLKQRPGWARLMAVFRILSYKRWRVMSHSTQSVGAFLLAAAGVVYFLAMTLGVHPYYWPNTKELSFGDSPPIATHAGFMALACMPFLYTLATKASLISVLTAISHEKLISWHMWIAWAMFVLALVHTFPFIVYHIWLGDIVAQWNNGGIWVTGVVALLAQAWLTFASIPWLRNRYYEFFKSTHRLAALVFIVFFFLHCDFRLSSWDYFIATAVLYSLSWCYSKCKTYFEYGVSHRARLQPETSDTLKITIDTTKARWTAGQHIFLRFLTGGMAHMLTAHPFTICSVPKVAAKAGGDTDTMVFYIRARGGLTKLLMEQAMDQPGMEVPVLMDGPYGGVPSAQLDASDQCLVIGGGSGTGFTLSVIEHFIRYHAITGSAKRGLKAIIATREPDTRLWYIEALEKLSNQYPEFNASGADISIDFHETGQGVQLENAEAKTLDVEKALNSATVPVHNKDDDAKQGDKSEKVSDVIVKAFNVTFSQGRPNLLVAVQQFVAREGVTTGLVVCGPSSMSHDVGEAAVSAQQHIIKGGITTKEVWFHTESFSY